MSSKTNGRAADTGAKTSRKAKSQRFFNFDCGNLPDAQDWCNDFFELNPNVPPRDVARVSRWRQHLYEHMEFLKSNPGSKKFYHAAMCIERNFGIPIVEIALDQMCRNRGIMKHGIFNSDDFSIKYNYELDVYYERMTKRTRNKEEESFCYYELFGICNLAEYDWFPEGEAAERLIKTFFRNGECNLRQTVKRALYASIELCDKSGKREIKASVPIEIYEAIESEARKRNMSIEEVQLQFLTECIIEHGTMPVADCRTTADGTGAPCAKN